MNFLDVSGQRFGRLVAIAPTVVRMRRAVVWRCVCDCGAEAMVPQSRLKIGRTGSCGCLRGGRITHGQSRTNTYQSWTDMLRRTEDPSRKDYRYYGARGIRVCKRWLKFENFLTDMGERPGGKTIDRIDVNGNYEPNNCRWATRAQQTANRRVGASA